MKISNRDVEPSIAVSLAKKICHIDKPNGEMTDEEIAIVCNWFAGWAPDTRRVDGELVIGVKGTGIMLFLALSEFPLFYQKHGLSQVN
ncbi:unnamed protein product [marine sediment metagenome]|uniref:Uncharacterized protein n=1 Tax=marine sediment metagenome TaxID=412755 RepID=X1QT71_9ZZZZ